MMNMFIYAVVFVYLRTACALLRDESELSNNCFDFPAFDFGKENNVRSKYGNSPHVILNPGDDAIDFTLPDNTGELVNLRTLLQSKPVVLLWGHYTCPAFQGLYSDTLFIGSSYVEEQLFVESVKAVVTVVHLVGPEPHPLWPDANFDSGSLKMNLWSTIRQPQTYDERIAESVSRVEAYVHDDALLLVDYLDGVEDGLRNNPVWCSYANAARAAVVIDVNGTVAYTQSWFSGPILTEFVLDAFS